MNLGILCGGLSDEHEISIISALDILKKISNIKLLYLDKENNLYYIKKPNIEKILNKKGKKIYFSKKILKKLKIDLILLVLHGAEAEGGQIQALLKFYEIPFIGSDMKSSVLGMDKELTYLKLKSDLINTLDKRIFYNLKDVRTDYYPVIVKPARSGSSIGINVCNDEVELLKYAKEAFEYDTKIIVEKYLENFREFSMALYKTKKFYYSKVEEIVNADKIFNYDQKYKNRTKGFLHKFLNEKDLISEIEDVASKIYNSFQTEGIVRIDFLYSDNILYVNEINTLPGSLSNYLFDDFGYVINDITRHYLYEYKKKKIANNVINEEILRLNSKK